MTAQHASPHPEQHTLAQFRPPTGWSQHGTVDSKAEWAAQFPVHVGVDTGKVFHKLVARGPDGRRLKPVRVAVSRAGFDAVDAYLVKAFPGIKRSEMLVGLEFGGHHGFTFAHDLHRRGYRVVTVLPSVTKKLKEVEDNSPRKDDEKDAGQICKLLSQGFFVSYPMLDDLVARLRILATERHRLAVEETRLKNRLQAALDQAWPEFVDHFCDLDKVTPRAILERWPVPQDFAAASLRSTTALAVEVSRNHIKADRVRAIREAARATIGVTVGLDARRREIGRLLARWRLLDTQIAEVEAELEALVEQHPGAKALTTVPKVNVVCAATLVAELGTPETYESPRQVIKLAGMNLVKKHKTGISADGRPKQTKRGRPLLRRQLFLLAGRWCQQQGLYRAQYERLVARNGGAKISAMCAIARKLVPMLLHVMQTGEAFDEAHWRRTHGLHLVKDSPYAE
jgi:transposase